MQAALVTRHTHTSVLVQGLSAVKLVQLGVPGDVNPVSVYMHHVHQIWQICCNVLL